MDHIPSRVSLKSFEHFAQLIKDNKEKIHKFDYGPEINM